MKKVTIFVLLLIILFPTFTNFETFLGNHEVLASNDGSIKSFSTNILLSTNDSIYPQHVEPTLAIGSNNELYVGWKEALSPSSGGVDVSFTKSLDGGITWTVPVTMPGYKGNDGLKSDPWLNIYNDTIYYSYLDIYNPQSPLFYSQVTMARSTDKGDTWLINKASENYYFADKEAFIISSNGTIYLTYNDKLETGWINLKLSKSIDGGITFSDVTRINDHSSQNLVGTYPAVSSNHTLCVSWLEITNSSSNFGDVYFGCSNNGGITFNSNKDLNPASDFGTFNFVGGYPEKATLPVMQFDTQDRLYILWAELNKNWKIYVKYSDDYGKHWSSKIAINDNNMVDQWQPDMAIDNNNSFHVAWFEELNNQYMPYYRTLSFSGNERSVVTKSTVLSIATNFTSSNFTRPGDYFTLRIDSDNIPHVVWTDGRSGKLDIYYASGVKNYTSTSTPGFITLFLMITLSISVIVIKKRKKM